MFKSRQTSAVAPASLAGKGATQVTISRYGGATEPFRVPVADLAPAIFTATPEGSTRGSPLNFRFGLFARSFTRRTVSLTIGGQPSRVIYTGLAPYQSSGMMQLNAFVPDGLAPGHTEVVLNVGGVDNVTQRATIVVGTP
jgi:hypothetical protein